MTPTQTVTTVTLPPEQLLGLIREAALAALAEHEQHKALAETLLTTSQALDFLRVSKVTLHGWRMSGKVPYRRIGRRVFYVKSELLAALESGRRGRERRTAEAGKKVSML